MRIRLACLSLATCLLPGCDVGRQLKDYVDQSTEMVAEIKQSTGANAELSIEGFPSELINVTVTFTTTPQNHTPSELASIVNKTTIRHFKNQPQNIVIAFVVE